MRGRSGKGAGRSALLCQFGLGFTGLNPEGTEGFIRRAHGFQVFFG